MHTAICRSAHADACIGNFLSGSSALCLSRLQALGQRHSLNTKTWQQLQAFISQTSKICVQFSGRRPNNHKHKHVRGSTETYTAGGRSSFADRAGKDVCSPWEPHTLRPAAGVALQSKLAETSVALGSTEPLPAVSRLVLVTGMSTAESAEASS